MTWDKDIIKEEGIIYISWEVLTGLLDNINIEVKVETFFFDKSVGTL